MCVCACVRVCVRAGRGEPKVARERARANVPNICLCAKRRKCARAWWQALSWTVEPGAHWVDENPWTVSVRPLPRTRLIPPPPGGRTACAFARGVRSRTRDDRARRRRRRRRRRAIL